MFDLQAICQREFEAYVASFHASDGHGPVPWLHAGIDYPKAAIPDLTRLTKAALEARLWFAENGPRWAQLLPLSLEECMLRICHEPRGYLLGQYSKSLWDLDYDIQRHPPFDRFCRGLMAAPPLPESLRNKPDLQLQFPPQELPGLNAQLCWHPTSGEPQSSASKLDGPWP